jgi:hypothetical protein
MDLSPYTQNLRDDLLAAASVGDEQTRRAAALLSTALEPAARLAIMNALSDLAAEVTGALDGTTVDLRLDGRELRVSVTHHESPAGNSSSWTGSSTGHESGGPIDDDISRAVREASGELSRTTLRLVGELKTQAEQAATAQGVSLNTYIQRAVSDAVRASVERGRNRRGGPHTVTGFVQG